MERTVEQHDDGDWHVSSSDYTKYDSVNRQHVLSEEKRHEGRDRELTREKRHGASVRESVTKALREEKRKAGSDLPYYNANKQREYYGDKLLAQKKLQQAADLGHDGPIKELPKNAQSPKTVRQTVELALATVQAAHAHGIQDDHEAAFRHRQDIELKQLFNDPHFQRHHAAYVHLKDEMLKPGGMSYLLPEHRKLIGGIDPKTGKFNPRRASPAGVRKLMGILEKELPKILERGRRTGQYYWGN